MIKLRCFWFAQEVCIWMKKILNLMAKEHPDRWLILEFISSEMQNN